MGSAEQGIILNDVKLSVPENEVSASDSFREDTKTTDNKDATACASDEVTTDSVEYSQTVDVKLAANEEKLTSEMNELTEERSPEMIQNCGPIVSDAAVSDGSSNVSENVEQRQITEVQYSVDRATESCENKSVSDNTSLPNCEASGVLASTTESYRSNVPSVGNVAVTVSDNAKELGLVGKPNIQTSVIQDYNEAVIPSYQQRPTLPRVNASDGASDGHIQTAADESDPTYWTAAVPPSDELPYGFRYGTLMLLTTK